MLSPEVNTPTIMMRTAGREQALTLASSRRKSLILTSAETPWAGLPFEMHSMRDIREAGESGPVDGEYGVMVVMETLVFGASAS